MSNSGWGHKCFSIVMLTTSPSVPIACSAKSHTNQDNTHHYSNPNLCPDCDAAFAVIVKNQVSAEESLLQKISESAGKDRIKYVSPELD